LDILFQAFDQLLQSRLAVSISGAQARLVKPIKGRAFSNTTASGLAANRLVKRAYCKEFRVPETV